MIVNDTLLQLLAFKKLKPHCFAKKGLLVNASALPI
jgi:hypothetical protein